MRAGELPYGYCHYINAYNMQNRMLDLKYSMQHLMARMLHKTNPKASLKAVDGMIQDVEAYVALGYFRHVSDCG
jgi:hypothetical protein